MNRKCIRSMVVAGAAVVASIYAGAAHAQALRVDINSDNLMEGPNPDSTYSETQGLNTSNEPNGNPNPPFDPWFINGGAASKGGDPRFNAPVFIDSDLTTPFTPHYPGTMVQLTAATGDVVDSARRFSLVGGSLPNYSYNDLYRDFAFNTNTSAPYDSNSATAGEHSANDGTAPNGPLTISVGGLAPNTRYAITLHTYDKWFDLDTVSAGQSVGVSRFRFLDVTSGSDGNTGISAMYGRNSAPGGELTNNTWAVTMFVTTDSGGTLTVQQASLPDFGTSGNTLTSAVLNGIEVNALSSQWSGGGGAGNTNFSNPANWTGAVPISAIPQGQFNNVVAYLPDTASPQSVTMDQQVTLSQLVLDSNNAYSIGGGGALTLSGGGISVLRGSHQIAAPVQATGNILNLTVLGAGNTLDFTNSVAVNDTTLTVPNSKLLRGVINKQGLGKAQFNNINASILHIHEGTLAVRTNGGASGMSHIGTLIIQGTPGPNSVPAGALDLGDNDLIVGKQNLAGEFVGTSQATIEDFVASARAGGAWTGGGITSSAAKSASPANKTLGVLSGAEYHSTGATLFNGVAVDDAQVLVKFTYYGDTDFNGVVNFDDYSRIDSGFLNARTGWLNGDFNFDDVVNFDDYALIDGAFLSQSGTLRPALLYLSGDGGQDMDSHPSLQFVRDHHQQFGDGYTNALLSVVPEPAGAALFGLALATAGLRQRRRQPGRA